MYIIKSLPIYPLRWIHDEPLKICGPERRRRKRKEEQPHTPLGITLTTASIMGMERLKFQAEVSNRGYKKGKQGRNTVADNGPNTSVSATDFPLLRIIYFFSGKVIHTDVSRLL